MYFSALSWFLLLYKWFILKEYKTIKTLCQGFVHKWRHCLREERFCDDSTEVFLLKSVIMGVLQKRTKIIWHHLWMTPKVIVQRINVPANKLGFLNLFSTFHHKMCYTRNEPLQVKFPLHFLLIFKYVKSYKSLISTNPRSIQLLKLKIWFVMKDTYHDVILLK